MARSCVADRGDVLPARVDEERAYGVTAGSRWTEVVDADRRLPLDSCAVMAFSHAAEA
jgi:hypothetical protein